MKIYNSMFDSFISYSKFNNAIINIWLCIFGKEEKSTVKSAYKEPGYKEIPVIRD